MQKRILHIFYFHIISLICTVSKLRCPAHLFPNTPRTLFHLPPLRLHCVGGCWDPGQLRLRHWLSDALTARLDLIQHMLKLRQTDNFVSIFHFNAFIRWRVFVFKIAIFALKRALRASLHFLLLYVAGAITYCMLSHVAVFSLNGVSSPHASFPINFLYWYSRLTIFVKRKLWR